MNLRELRQTIRADLFRYDQASGAAGFLRAFTGEPGFRLTTLMRVTRFLRQQPLTRWGPYHLSQFWLGRLSRKLGVFVDFTTEIGPGLYLGHPAGIVINRRCRIGANCNIAQHVTLGLKSRDPRAGCPELGDRVYVGPGAVIIGAIRVGHDTAVGANAVVTHDAPDHAVVAGVPAKIISMRGSEGYINHCLPPS
jgi:serine O-acetyltransferase